VGDEADPDADADGVSVVVALVTRGGAGSGSGSGSGSAVREGRPDFDGRSTVGEGGATLGRSALRVSLGWTGVRVTDRVTEGTADAPPSTPSPCPAHPATEDSRSVRPRRAATRGAGSFVGSRTEAVRPVPSP
jgi:hypothetical protein